MGTPLIAAALGSKFGAECGGLARELKKQQRGR
jgi:hypothetical protein